MKNKKLDKVLNGTIVALLCVYSAIIGSAVADYSSKKAVAEAEPAPTCTICHIEYDDCFSIDANQGYDYPNLTWEECKLRNQPPAGTIGTAMRYDAPGPFLGDEYDYIDNCDGSRN